MYGLATFHKGERLFSSLASEGRIVILESHEPVHDYRTQYATKGASGR